MDKSRIDRINELYRKSKAEGSSEVEKMEQQILLEKNISMPLKRNLTSQLDNISIQEKDGSITDLGKKHGHKKGN